jgi:hypothetical protein
MGCDDGCTFKINVADPLNPDTATTVLTSHGWSGYRTVSDTADRSADSPNLGVTFSEWVSLVADEHYYVEATLAQAWGPVNINVGMEIEPDVMPAEHPRMERMVQKMALGQTNLAYDTLVVNVIAADGGTF